MKSAVVGLDIGTSSIKYVVWDGESLLDQGRLSYSQGLSTDFEMDPQSLLSDVWKTIRQITQSKRSPKIDALGLSVFFPSLIVVDNKKRPLTPIYTWMDNRAASLVRDFKKENTDSKLREKTGCMVHESHTFWKILWLSEQWPDVFGEADQFWSLSEYLFFQLTGKCFVTTSLASATGLFNISSLGWDAEILEKIPIDRNQLPECVDLCRAEPILPGIADEVGLSRNTQVAPGSGDGICSNIGCGALSPNRVCSTMGTSSALRVVHDGDYGSLLNWRYHLTGHHFVSGMAINAGLDTLHWFLRVFRTLNMEDAFKEIRENRWDSSSKIIFLPFLNGERGPGYHQNRTASFFGLTSATTPIDILKGVVQGVFFNLYQCFRILCLEPSQELIATGGYAHSTQLLQLQADIFNRTVHAPEIQEASALGAAIIAGIASGLYKSIWDPKPTFTESFHPVLEHHEKYQEAYLEYKKFWDLYAGTAPT